MAAKKKPATGEAAKTPELELATEIILKSPRFAQYQPDFLRALLPEKTYTISKAARIVTAFFEKIRR